MELLFALFALSVMLPVYTYAGYPVALKLFKEKKFIDGNKKPMVSVIVLGSSNETELKAKSVADLKYPALEIIKSDNIIDGVNKAKGEILLFTDCDTTFDREAIDEIVKPFANENVGGVVGMQSNPNGNSTFWKYENVVKRLESRIGCVSGANNSIFAVRKRSLPKLKTGIKNYSFYIATSLTQDGKDVVYNPKAIAYEGSTEGTNFKKHVGDAAGYWQALRLFPKMLLPCKGSFVYVSHRVLKWFVWLNMVTALITSAILSFYSFPFLVIFLMQLVVYFSTILFGKRVIAGHLGKIIGIFRYFMYLNISYFCGLIQRDK